MDESSRNIIKFIAAGTGAILLLMAAYFFGRGPDSAPGPQAASEKASNPGEQEKPVVKPLTDNEEYVTDEEIPPITGEPSAVETPGE